MSLYRKTDKKITGNKQQRGQTLVTIMISVGLSQQLKKANPESRAQSSSQ